MRELTGVGFLQKHSDEGEDLRGQGWKVDKEEGNRLRNILLQIIQKWLKRPFFVCTISLVCCPSFLPCLVSTQM